MRRASRQLTAAACLLIAAFAAGASPAWSKPFSWAFQTDINELDPQARRVVFTRTFLANIMEPLVSYGKDLQIEPVLAESWSLVAPDRWRFKLRKNATFSNGYPFGADDVVATFERGMNEASPYRGALAGAKSVEKIDDLTVDILTSGPYPILTRDLTDVLIFSKRWLEEHAALAPVDPTKGQESYTLRHILGTGPFALRSYEPDSKIVLEENTTWWNAARKEHNLTEVTFRPIKASPTRVAALLSGEVDMIYPVALQDVDRIRQSGGFKIVEGPDITTMYLGMRIGQDKLTTGEPNPFKDIRVRQALYQAIDTKTLVDRIMRGKATEATVLMSPYHQGYDKRFGRRAQPYDIEGARKLLAAAGYPNGFKASMVCPNDRYVNDQAICIALVGMLAKAGIKVDLQSVPASRWLPMMNNAETDMWVGAWTAVGTIDAHSYLHTIMHSRDEKKGFFNAGLYSNKRMDELEELVARETDDAKRLAYLYEAFSLHRQDLPQIPLLQPMLIWGMKDSIHVHQLPNSSFNLRWVRVD
ncbi:ABC transporter substrate-binding protein [Bradyrhizobium sp. NP1]|uniref:ABC transporter substrate-binding protein n=1 Tax=Bradyrhizobium sp. NP1 TaxID=3049772 RepID=UPI0025A5174B|nr:ABC transporter substrate-binding protein [Bradyrhizobium sp. NP1]WJR77264.1 ABC transporter substrate-binding protein [Bradyrhizobium sp. NP1]